MYRQTESHLAARPFLLVLLSTMLVSACSSSSSSSGPGWSGGGSGGSGGGIGGGTPPGQGRLTVNVEEGGTVTSSPDIGTCSGPAICAYDADLGLVVTLTATPDSGWAFEEWELCDRPSGTTCVTTIVESKTIIAEFDRTP